MIIKINNTPNLYEYVIMVASLVGLSVYAWSYSLVWILISVVIILLWYSKRMTITLLRASLEIHFTIGPFTYRNFNRRFNKVTSDEEAIRFYDNSKIIFTLDIGVAPEENEAHAIALQADRKNFTIGNKKNYLQTFQQIKQFYQGQHSL